MNLGDYIYTMRYYFPAFGKGKRELRRLKIQKINSKTISTSYGLMSKEKIGVKWFLTPLDAYKDALRLHLKEYGDVYDEINYLKKKVESIN